MGKKDSDTDTVVKKIKENSIMCIIEATFIYESVVTIIKS